MRRIVMALASCALALTPVLAAGKPSESAQHDAAEELLVTIHLDTTMDAMTDLMVKTQIEANPKLADFEDIMRAFMKKYISFEAMKEDFIRMYSEAFSEKELREMATFYRSPTGQKCIGLMPSLLQKGGELGKTRVTEHIDELRAAVEARVKEKSTPAPDPSTKETAPPGKNPGGR